MVERPRVSDAAGENLHVAGFVGGLDGEDLHDLAKMRVQPCQHARGDQQSRRFVLDEIGHDLDDGAPDERFGQRGISVPVCSNRVCFIQACIIRTRSSWRGPPKDALSSA